MNFIQKLKLNRKYKKIYKPFFLSANKELNKLCKISDPIPNEVSLIYKDLLKSKKNKYTILIKEYENFSSTVFLHNQKVEQIEKGIIGFDKNEFLSNSIEYSKEKLNDYYKIALLIDEFKDVDANYEEFKNIVLDFYQNYELIIHQKKILIDLTELYLKISNLQYIDSKQAKNLLYEHKELISKIDFKLKVYYNFNNFLNLQEFIKKHNNEFIELNLSNILFDDINGKSLDKEQRKSILTDELSTLVVAGAGSGKTLTICGKVIYLLKEKNIKPEEILLLSYSKKSADDLQKKVLNINNKLVVGTFHKLGLDILKLTQNKVFMIEDQYKAIIEKYFREEMQKKPKILEKILKYYGLYLSSNQHDKKYQNDGELFQDLKKNNFTTLKNISNDIFKKETIKKEKVKSFEELAIANYYFINGIDYIYEHPYKVDTSTSDKRQYMPDFYLKKYKIYHEHYGINKDGLAVQYEGPEAQKYVENMKWKRNIHKTYNTTCLETYSYEFSEDTLFNKLEKELKEKGVEFHPLSSEQILNAMESIYEEQSFKSFINLVKTFLSLYKANYTSVEGFEKLLNYHFANLYEKQRAKLFLEIVKDVYLYYIDYLSNEGKIDFDDMILQSIKELDNTNQFQYKYIIVDEFQDISISRMKFLNKLREHGNSKLFAVGDDWQAIYRFSGCDLDIFLNFSKYFGDSEITKITTTHRNSQQLQDIAGPFIKSNPEQFDKKISSSKYLENPIQIMYYSDKKYYAFLDLLKEINKLNSEANVLILGRNNKDFETIAMSNRIYIDYRHSNENKIIVKVADFPHMHLSYSTVHGSKGLEEDYVIIINADDSRLGFPNKMEDDELLNMVLSSKSNYEYAEERRLWYVALTRTRNYTYILAHNENHSIFVKEIESKCKIINPNMEIDHKGEINCPKCKSGRLVLCLNSSTNENFYGCSNYPYCDYTIYDFKAVQRNMRCKSCGDFMIYRRGQWGPFYGCHNYPKCKNIEKYTSNDRYKNI